MITAPFTLTAAANASGLVPDTLAARGQPDAPMHRRIAVDPKRTGTFKRPRGRPPEAAGLKVLRALLKCASKLTRSNDTEVQAAALDVLQGLKRATRIHLASRRKEAL